MRQLEELGIGRPSTYASIISVLQERNYVRLESRRFVPEERGRVVTAFLVGFFDQYVQPGFTADLESQLDEIAAGSRHWKQVLREFWDPFSEQVDEVKERRVAEVIDALNELLAPHLFPPREDGSDPRVCPLCGSGQLSLKLGRFGAFVGCSNYPECRFTRRLGEPLAADPEEGELKERVLGVDPDTGEEIRLKRGPYGPYVQRGAGEDVKRSSLPPNLSPDQLDLATALKLLDAAARARPASRDRPADRGRHQSLRAVHQARPLRAPRAGRRRADHRHEPRDRAARRMPAKKTRPAPKVLKELGAHPKDKKPVVLYQGRFGPYLKHGQQTASLRKGHDPDAADPGGGGHGCSRRRPPRAGGARGARRDQRRQARAESRRPARQDRRQGGRRAQPRPSPTVPSRTFSPGRGCRRRGRAAHLRACAELHRRPATPPGPARSRPAGPRRRHELPRAVRRRARASTTWRALSASRGGTACA